MIATRKLICKKCRIHMLLPRCNVLSTLLASDVLFLDMMSANMAIVNKMKQDPTVIPIIVRLESDVKH